MGHAPGALKPPLPRLLAGTACVAAVLATAWFLRDSSALPTRFVVRPAPVADAASAPDAIERPAPASSDVPAPVPVAAPDPDNPEASAAFIRSLRPDVAWRAPVSEPAFASFRQWTDEYLASPDPAAIERGVALARERRAALTDLIEQDPQRALALAVPQSVRRRLPAAVAAELEERLSGRGDMDVVAALPMPGHEAAVRPVTRTVRIDGREFDTFTWGHRAASMTRRDLAINGIALDGRMALSEWPARVLEPEEVKEARAALDSPPLCPVSKMPLDENGDEIVLDFSLETAHWYCQAGHATQELLAAAAAEAALPPGVAASGIGGGLDLPVAASPYTEGTKRMLIIRVDFPDKTGQVVSDTTLTNLINNMATQWSNMSYGRTTWSRVGEGSAFTPTLRLPNNHGSYTGFGTMLNAARAAAEDAGFDYRDYHFEVVVTGDKPDVGFGGVAFVGGRGAWLANGQWNLGVCSHEVGHNFGLNHSGFWDTTDGTAIGAGSNVEYGNPFDHMGGASSSGSAHFNARQKNYLDWIPDSNVRKVTADGSVTQRISAMDRTDATGHRAIAVDRSGTSQDYWIEYRTAYSSNKWMRDGVVVNFGDVSINNGKPSLLDFTPNTSSKDDCPILIGRTFSDTGKNIHITPLGRGTDATTGVPWMDVRVNRGAFTGNARPTAALTYGPANPAVNANATFNVAGTDPDGDALAYFWDWGDGNFTANNSPSATYRWTTAGIKTVRCTVSDMKGQTTTANALVQVGTSSTFFISGYVRTAGGLPLEGVVINAGGRTDETDADGFYAVTGLAAGNHTVTASRPGFTFNTSGFTNPVSVGPSRANANYVAPPGAPVFSPIKPGLVDAGSNTGAVPLALTDNDTPLASLTITAISSNTAVLANDRIAIGSGTTRTITVTAPSTAASATVDITITAADPEGSTATYVWPVTINRAPVNSPATVSVAENASVDIDLRAMAADDATPDDSLGFEVDRARNGSVRLLTDGRTARFTPNPDFHGTAGFRLQTRDRSLSSRTLLLLDFEPVEATDVIATGTVPDLSNFNRSGALDSVGNGEYAASDDIAPALVPHSTIALNLTENGSGGAARLVRTFTAADLNWNDADWTFTTWVKRTSSDSEDFVFHLGDGDGHGSQDELEVFFAAGSSALRLEKHNASGVQASIVHPDVPTGEWHHIAVTYDRTATNAGTLALYVDGFLVGSATGVAMAVNQSQPMVVGGHASTSANLDRWLDGLVDEVMIDSSVLSRTAIRRLAGRPTSHYLGLSDADSVTVTVTGTNQPPSLVPPADVGMNTGVASPPLAFRVRDAESEARALSVSATTSNPALIPLSGIGITGAPPAFASADIGTVGAAGSSVEERGAFIISGSGVGIGGTADEFRFVSQDATGDGDWRCRVVSLDVTHQAARCGLMVRDGTAAGAAFAMIAVTAADGIVFQTRTAAGAAATATPVNFVAAPVWLRLVRSGAGFTGQWAPDENGQPGAWRTAGTATGFTMPAAVRSGFAVSSHVDATLAMAICDRLEGFRMGGDRSVILTPAAGQTGIADITLTVSDGAASVSGSFRAVVGINLPPTLGEVAPVTVTDGTVPAPFTMALGDLHTPVDSLTLTASSSDSRILPAGRVVITGTGAERTVQLRPVPGESGTTTVTLTVSDGSLTTSRTFTLTVLPGDPARLVSAGTNWRFLDTGALPAGWQTLAFNDSAWPVGPAQLGFGEGDESTLVNATASRKVTLFRRAFTLTDAAAWSQLRLRLVRDDGAVVWLNGREIWRTNMPDGPVTATTDAVAAVGGADESRWFETLVRNPGFVAGTNVLAVQIHQKGTTSSDLSFDLEARGTNPEPVAAVAPGDVWRYLDTGTDPGATWTGAAFDDSAWKSGASPLGYGDGDEATVVDDGPDTARHVTTWFRRQFTVTDAAMVSGIGLRLQRDDGILVWLNGQQLFLDNLPATGVTASTLALRGIANADEAAWLTAWLPPSLLVEGTNTLAVEVHQASRTSSDLSFDMELLLYPWDALPAPAVTPGPSTLTITWPHWAAGWRLQSSADLRTWTPETVTPVQGAGGWTTVLPRTAARRWFRMVMP